MHKKSLFLTQSRDILKAHLNKKILVEGTKISSELNVLPPTFFHF